VARGIVECMSAVGGLQEAKPSRRKRAAKTVEAALRGGILGAVVAAVGWLLATALFGTAVLVLVVATIGGAIYTVARGEKTRYGIWGLLAIGWGIVLVEHWAVSGHGGFFVGVATWLGVVAGARRAGMSNWSLPLLAYPALFGAIIVLSGHDLLKPWGISWLWVAAVLGPVIGARTLLNPSPRTHEPDRPAPKRDPLADL
jgi:hypothetical protein